MTRAIVVTRFFLVLLWFVRSWLGLADNQTLTFNTSTPSQATGHPPTPVHHGAGLGSVRPDQSSR